MYSLDCSFARHPSDDNDDQDVQQNADAQRRDRVRRLGGRQLAKLRSIGDGRRSGGQAGDEPHRAEFRAFSRRRRLRRSHNRATIITARSPRRRNNRNSRMAATASLKSSRRPSPPLNHRTAAMSNLRRSPPSRRPRTSSQRPSRLSNRTVATSNRRLQLQ